MENNGDFSRKQNDFILNVTRSKHEAMNRFYSLETRYNMLKAQNKELDTDYNRLRQQYTRLSSEHSQLNNQQKRNYQLYKEQKTNEIASLDGKVACPSITSYFNLYARLYNLSVLPRF
ncbi:hypothetical protein OS493_036185 [Desmophyllum pertusum]|uniref:Uncharacterized protein n=1 Tax=Desmophyllum pertusum TaxID=174260 RepID=A0A9W9Z891_9CNID|nr:hypothetical protein OS493_036185 [Desmophyllum pertusum]